MSRGKLRFKQRDVARAIRAAVRSGVPSQRVEIDREGKIIVILGTPSAANELDQELAQFETRHGQS
jgi:hypothetical protein